MQLTATNFLDFSKALDTVNHNILIEKPDNYIMAFMV